MDLIEIGAALREGRERKGLTVEAVENKTKIAVSVIMALEEGNQARFPHPVYARGFVRSYAQVLGLDAAELCAHFSREYPVPTDSDHPEPHSPGITVKSMDAAPVLTLIRIGAVVSIVVVGVVGWYLYGEYRNGLIVEQKPAAQQVESETNALASGDGLPPEAVPVPSVPLTQMQEVAADSQNESVEAGDVNATLDEAGNATEAEPADPEVAAESVLSVEVEPSAAIPPTGERTMVINAHSTSWLQVRADGGVEDYLLRKGEATTVTFNKSLSIKFGNAGGVNLQLDGKPYPFEAEMGEVKTLVVQ